MGGGREVTYFCGGLDIFAVVIWVCGFEGVCQEGLGRDVVCLFDCFVCFVLRVVFVS